MPKKNLLESLQHKSVSFSHNMPSGTKYTCESCGEEHEVGDVNCVVYYNSRLSHIDCLVQQLGDVVLAIEALTRYPESLHDIKGFASGNGIWWCSNKECDYFISDGMDKGTCKLLGSRPKSVCIPWLTKLVQGIHQQTTIEEL